MTIKRYNTLQENEPLGQVRPGDFRFRGCEEHPEGWLVTYTDHLAALSSAPQGWRDIKDAPKDGTQVDLWEYDGQSAPVRHCGYRWDGAHWVNGSVYLGRGQAEYLTNWMPLPAAPATKSPASEV